MTNQIDLSGRTAVITGGSSGIGAAIAEHLRSCGARVARWDIDQAATTAEPSETLQQNVDVTSPESVVAAAEDVVRRWGAIDILVNSAGITGPTVELWNYPIEDWMRVQRVNLDGTFLCCRAIVPFMIARNYGRIVNISSVAGKEGNPKAAAYSAAKAGVIALTKSLGKELASHDISVNCITPTAAKTALFDRLDPDFVQYMLSKIPRGRVVTLDEISSMVSWLCSSENSFTTGAVFDLSGGRTTY